MRVRLSAPSCRTGGSTQRPRVGNRSPSKTTWSVHSQLGRCQAADLAGPHPCPELHLHHAADQRRQVGQRGRQPLFRHRQHVRLIAGARLASRPRRLTCQRVWASSPGNSSSSTAQLKRRRMRSIMPLTRLRHQPSPCRRRRNRSPSSGFRQEPSSMACRTVFSVAGRTHRPALLRRADSAVGRPRRSSALPP